MGEAEPSKAVEIGGCGVWNRGNKDMTIAFGRSREATAGKWRRWIVFNDHLRQVSAGVNVGVFMMMAEPFEATNRHPSR